MPSSRGCAIAAAALAAASFVQATAAVAQAGPAEQAEITPQLELGAATRYISEGVDQLADHPIATAAGSLHAGRGNQQATLGAVLIQGLGVDYTEVELGAGLSRSLSDALTGSLGVAYINQFPDTGHDWEVSTALDADLGDGWTGGLSYVESIRGAGGFLGVSLGADLFTHRAWTLSGTIAQFADFGYVTPRTDALNHLELSMSLVRDGLPATVTLSHAHAQRNLDAAQPADAPDETWLTITYQPLD